MRHPLLAISFLLCEACIFVWAHSHRDFDMGQYVVPRADGGGTIYKVLLLPDRVWIARTSKNWLPADVHSSWLTHPLTNFQEGTPHPEWDCSALGFHLWRFSGGAMIAPGTRPGPPVQEHYVSHVLIVPLWFPTTALALMSIAACCKAVRTRRRRSAAFPVVTNSKAHDG